MQKKNANSYAMSLETTIPEVVRSSRYRPRFTPVIVTRVPPQAGPEVGEIELSTATGATEEVSKNR